MQNQLKMLRLEQNWTQRGLAQQLNVSRQTVIAIETGRYDPSLPLAFRIASLFDRSIEEIFHPKRSGMELKTLGDRRDPSTPALRP